MDVDSAAGAEAEKHAVGAAVEVADCVAHWVLLLLSAWYCLRCGGLPVLGWGEGG